MPSKQSLRRKLARERAAAIEAQLMEFRLFTVREVTIDVDKRSIGAIVSTEAPVPMPDWERGMMIPEVLLTSGVEFPPSRQVPLLDSHQRYSMETQLGSARDLLQADGRVETRLFFSATAESEWTKVREGHATDVSAGYQVLKRTFVPRGETQTIAGRQYTGPVNVVTKWRLREVSLTPIGADEQAKLRGLDPTALFREESESFDMNAELRTLLETRGMPKTHTDDEAQKWLLENPGRLADPPKPKDDPAKPPEGQRAGGQEITADDIRKLIADGIKAATADQLKARTEFEGEIRSLCELADLPDEVNDCLRFTNVAEVRIHLAERKKKIADELGVNPAPHVRVTGDGMQRFEAAIGTALALRCAKSVAEKKETIETVMPEAKRAKGYTDFADWPLYSVAEEFVRMSGIDPRGLPREQIAICAMFGPEAAGLDRRNGYGAAYHVTGSFPKITQDAFNKSMQIGYTEAPSTWEGPMRRGQPAEDFKNLHRMRLGAIPNLPIWPDNTDPQKASFADADEVYAVESRSLEVGFSYRLIVNDDMNALTVVPVNLGQSARRTVNAVAWSIVTSNPTMSDGQALFLENATGNRKRSNLTTGAATPTVTTVGGMTNKMRQMRGENTPEGNESDDVLSIQPKYLVGPSALEVVINQLVNSAYDPSSSVNHQTYNPTRVLTPVIEPLLDASSTTAFYIWASPAQVDTVELSFLRGQESPVVRNFMDQRSLSQFWTVLQTFGAKALNHRGIQKHNGA